MTYIKYDPELPYVVRMIDGEVISRHTTISGAKTYLEITMQGYGEVIDTTPKPKIPEDADYLIFEFEGETHIAYRDDNDWYASGEWWTTPDLEEALKDAEVTVLVRKEDS